VGCAVAISGGGGGIADAFVSSTGFAIVTTAGAGFSELPESAQTPTPATTTTTALAPIQSNFFEAGCVNEVEDSTSKDRFLAGGTVAMRVEEGALDAGRAGSRAEGTGQGGADGRCIGLSETGAGGGAACRASLGGGVGSMITEATGSGTAIGLAGA
jgi:hypothetical protein